MFGDSFTNGYDIPYCQVWIGSRSGAPTLVGDSLQKLGIFSDDITARKYFTSVDVILEAQKPNTASIKIADPFGLMDRGIHAGVPCYIKFGYASKPGSFAVEPQAKVLFMGVLQRETVSFTGDGLIEIDIPCRDTTDKMRYEKKTRAFSMLPRQMIIANIMKPYTGSVFGVGVTLFKTMTQVEKEVQQVNMTDLEFIYKLALSWGCTFDTRPNLITNKLEYFFVDDSADGDKLISALQSFKNTGPVYKMEWRTGLKNVSSLKFNGDASSAGGQGGILVNKDGKMEVVKADIGSADEHDPSNWELDQSKVDKWIRANPNSTMEDFNQMAFAKPIPELHNAFFKKRTAQRFGSPTAPDSQSSSGLGAGGFRCDFELTRGDPFLDPNTPVDLGGDIYSRFKSAKVEIGKDMVVKKEQRFVPEKSGMLYWRVLSVTHSFGADGLMTKGTLKR